MPRLTPLLFVLLVIASPVSAQGLDATAELMRELTEAPGPSAFEDEVRDVVVRAFDALDARIEYDGLGSVLARV